jgi:hypothetical protein
MIQDAGGVPLAGGGRMRSGMVFRISGALAGASELAELSSHRLQTIVDLRSEREDRSSVIEWASADGVAYWNYPIIVGRYEGNTDNDMFRAAENGTHVEYLEYAYGQLATAFGPQLATAVERIAEGFPAGFGCAAGKDRTGIMSAYLQVICGADEETAIASYLEKAPTIDQLRPQLQQLFGIGQDEEIPPGMTYILTVNPHNMTYAFDRVRELGGVEAFLRSYGLSGGAIDAIRAQLIEA